MQFLAHVTPAEVISLATAFVAGLAVGVGAVLGLLRRRARA